VVLFGSAIVLSLIFVFGSRRLCLSVIPGQPRRVKDRHATISIACLILLSAGLAVGLFHLSLTQFGLLLLMMFCFTKLISKWVPSA